MPPRSHSRPCLCICSWSLGSQTLCHRAISRPTLERRHLSSPTIRGRCSAAWLPLEHRGHVCPRCVGDRDVGQGIAERSSQSTQGHNLLGGPGLFPYRGSALWGPCLPNLSTSQCSTPHQHQTCQPRIVSSSWRSWQQLLRLLRTTRWSSPWPAVLLSNELPARLAQPLQVPP